MSRYVVEGMPENEQITRIMTDILNFPSEPSVYDVYVKKASYLGGYSAVVNFRGEHSESITAGGDSPSEALVSLYNTIDKMYAPCERCGRKGKRGDV